MAKPVDDRGRGARMAKRDEGAYCWYVTEQQRSHPGKPGCIGREGDRLGLSRALSSTGGLEAAFLVRIRSRVVLVDVRLDQFAHEQEDGPRFRTAGVDRIERCQGVR